MSEVTLRQLYELLKKIWDKFMEFPSEGEKIKFILWILGAKFHRFFPTYPYLYIFAIKESGKSRSLNLIAYLLDGIHTTNVTESVLFREKKPLMLDELENIGRKDKADLRTLLNVGYKKGGVIERAKKIRRGGMESFVIERFDAYKPIAMANISGIDDVLEGRCITTILERSFNPFITKKFEIWQYDQDIQNYLSVSQSLTDLKCSLCSYVVSDAKENIYNNTKESTVINVLLTWNKLLDIIKETTLTTYTSYTTQTTLTTPTKEIIEKSIEKYKELHNQELHPKLVGFFHTLLALDISGREIELYFPLLFIAYDIGEDVFNTLVEEIKRSSKERKVEDISENRDIAFLTFLVGFIQGRTEDFMEIRTITKEFKALEEEDWISSRWVGKALRRLKVIKAKRRLSKGIEVILNFERIMEKARRYGVEVEKIMGEALDNVKESEPVVGRNPYTGQRAPPADLGDWVE